MFSAEDLHELEVIEGALAAWVARCEPESCTGAEAVAALGRVANIKRSLTGIECLLGPRVDESRAWRASGASSAVEFLARQSGSTVGEAKGLLEVGKRLPSQPEVASAVRAGELSSPQVREISEAAADAPGAAAGLVAGAAGQTLAELRQECQRERAVGRSADEQAARAHRNRRVRHGVGSDGSFWLHWTTTKAQGQEFLAHLEPHANEAFQRARGAGQRESLGAYLSDAMVATGRLSTQVLTGQPVGEGLFGPGSPAPDYIPEPVAPTAGGRRGRRRPVSPRAQVTKVNVRVDAAALDRGHTVPGELCEIAGAGPIPVSEARDLIGEGAFVAALAVRGVDILNAVHLGRQPLALQRTVLDWLQPTCAVEGCSRSAFLEYDHRDPWANTHHTRADGMDRLCTYHHDLKTRYNAYLVPGTGKRRMIIPPGPEPPDLAEPEQRHEGHDPP